MSSDTPVPRGFFRRIWHTLRRPSARYSFIALLSTGFIAGILFWGGFNTAMDATNSLEFCISCHEMRDTVYAEYKETVHYNNRTGVRAVCSDCHVPKDWGHKMARKAKAAFEVWGKITGSIDTPEKFEAKRMQLATNEWQRMKESGSRECRNCHNFGAMELERQKPTARRNHTQAMANGKTCIDCHKGIAHLLPAEYEEEE
ncbi:MAG TPA: Denitrification system component NirT [Rhodocyclaceae bacterium]|nr:Denitrification system component NirT [Rhodocyclaceae bacterium]